MLPLPGDLLSLGAELTKRLDRIRWTMHTGPYGGSTERPIHQQDLRPIKPSCRI